MQLMLILVAMIVAYLVGALSGALLLAPLFGQADPRTGGSGNAGATNALRTGGRAYGVAVLLFDLLKGVVAAGIVPWLLLPEASGWAFACGAAGVLGHVYPVFFGFRGGKGAATLIGVLLVLLPAALVIGLLVWVATLVLTGFVGLSTLLGMVAVTAWTLVSHAGAVAASLFVLAMLVLVFHTHRGNIRRMHNGSENRFTRIMLRKPDSQQ